MRAFMFFAVMSALLMPFIAAAEPVPSAATVLAGPCVNCHGVDGRGAGAIPSIAGKPAEALLQSLKEFKSGSRQATVMDRLAKGYSDEQLRSLASYFANNAQ